MKGFIEVTDRISSKKVFINVAHIQNVTSVRTLATIRLSSLNGSIDTKETYEQVVSLIREAIHG